MRRKSMDSLADGIDDTVPVLVWESDTFNTLAAYFITKVSSIKFQRYRVSEVSAYGEY